MSVGVDLNALQIINFKWSDTLLGRPLSYTLQIWLAARDCKLE